ncbi:MAG: 7-carboxy-7-deazaguanine synthase QueE [Planctomycetota bacterium]|jgi:7-carboxy-7-deazaguanine synthase
MIVNEIFYTLQGEGKLAGAASVFIRLAGCPLRCRWCDTKYAWDASVGNEMSAQQVITEIEQYPTRFAVVTGGEPMTNPDVGELVRGLHQAGYHVTVETAGIAYIADLPVDLMSISPKLSNSTPEDAELAAIHEPKRFRADVLDPLVGTYDYQLKFVVDTPADFNEIAECLGKLENVNPYKIYLMPQAVSPTEYIEKSRWLADFCLQTGFAYSPRLQVLLWPGQKGK